MTCRSRHIAILAGVLATAALVATPATAASVWEGDGPWGPYGWDEQNGRFHQPRLGTPIPAPAPLRTYDQADFDGDGVANVADNCLLVTNPDQEPARRPRSRRARRAYRKNFGPADLLALSARWKNQHPRARFRDDSELGEACSGYTDHYLRTTRALIKSSNRRKLEVFRFLAQSGPMFGGAANPFPTGKPTSYDSFGSVGGAATPSPTPHAALARDANGNLAKGNLAPSMPMCSGYDQYAGFIRWLSGSEGLDPLDEMQEQGRRMWEEREGELGCGSALQRPGWEQAMRHFWAGKRLYTNASGGRITNRFVASMTEHPLYEAGVAMEPFNTLAEQTGFHPYADNASGQSRHGIIFRARSYIDGRDAIMMDWRGYEAAWPLGQSDHIHGMGGTLIYDECRAIQTGVYNCTAVTDWVMGERRHTFQEGYMPWVLKGPPSIDRYLAATR
jgi:hypothetical protein